MFFRRMNKVGGKGNCPEFRGIGGTENCFFFRGKFAALYRV